MADTGGLNIRARLFGTLVVRAGLATEKQVRECIAIQKAARDEGRTPPRLGEIMAQKEYLSREQVQSILRGDFAEPGKRFGELCVGMKFCAIEQIQETLTEQEKLRGEGAVQRIGTLLVNRGYLRAPQIPAVLAAQGIEIAECARCRMSYNVAVDSPASALKCLRCGRELIMVTGFEEIDTTPLVEVTGDIKAESGAAPLPQAGMVPASPLESGAPGSLPAPGPVIVEEEEVSLEELMGSGAPETATAQAEDVAEAEEFEEAEEVAEAEEVTEEFEPVDPAEAARELAEAKGAAEAAEPAEHAPPVPVEAAPAVEPTAVVEEAAPPVYGEYRVLQRIGQDAIGGLYQAEHTETGETVALRIIELEKTRDRDFFARFVEETKKAAALDHPALKRVISAGRAHGHLYYASKFVEGKSVRSLLESRPGSKKERTRRLSLRAANRIVRTVAEGLSYAHQRGVFHGDIRPSNILVMPDGKVVLSETGVPKNVRANVERLAQAVGVTPFYMAPELAVPGGKPDARSDIYELGATYYHMATGRPPFTGDTPLQIFMRMAEEEAVPADTVVTEIPRGISDFVSDMMAPEPADRPESMDKVIAALDRASDVTTRRAGTTGLDYPKAEAVPEGVPGRPVPVARRPKVGAPRSARRKSGMRRAVGAGEGRAERRRAASPPRGSSAALGIAVVVGVIAAAGIAAFFIWQKRKSMEEKWKREAAPVVQPAAPSPVVPSKPAARQLPAAPAATPRRPAAPAVSERPAPRVRPKPKPKEEEEKLPARTRSLFGPGGTLQRRAIEEER